MKRVGLTGGIASGKSTVAAIFRQLGVPTLDADALWHELAVPGSYILGRIADEFGPEVINGSGTLHRKALAAKVFADPYQLAKLNALTHPAVAALAEERFQALASSGTPMVIYESALIFETQMQSKFDFVVTVWAPVETQIERLFRRNGIEREEAERRIASQMRALDKVRLSTYDIYTGGTLHDVWEETAYVHARLK